MTYIMLIAGVSCSLVGFFCGYAVRAQQEEEGAKNRLEFSVALKKKLRSSR